MNFANKKLLVFCAICLLLVLILVRLTELAIGYHSEVQAYLVLGGSAKREVYAAGLAKAHPQRLIIISGGSPDPCVHLLFDQTHAPMHDHKHREPI